MFMVALKLCICVVAPEPLVSASTQAVRERLARGTLEGVRVGSAWVIPASA